MNDKRFLVFAYDTYYPHGGMFDLKDSFDTIEEAVERIKQGEQLTDRNGKVVLYHRDYYEVYDRVNGVEIDLSKYGIE